MDWLLLLGGGAFLLGGLAPLGFFVGIIIAATLDWLKEQESLARYPDVLPSYPCQRGEHDRCDRQGWNRNGGWFPIPACPCPCHKAPP